MATLFQKLELIRRPNSLITIDSFMMASVLSTEILRYLIILCLEKNISDKSAALCHNGPWNNFGVAT